jgi:glycosyltransferase involved in cell wall biosynthesis
MVSVIVPFRNPGAHFEGLLESLAQQQFEKPWEIILVDNGSSDGAPAHAKKYSGRLDLRVIEAAEKANASYARNVGVRAANFEKLLFIDADDQVDRFYVAAMVDALESHEFVTSRVDSLTLNAEWVQTAQGPPWQESGVIVFFGFLPATGVNIGIRRGLFDSVGGFPEEFSGSQDIAFSWRVQLLAGKTIHFVPDAVYRYRYRDNMAGLYRQSCNWGFSNTLLYRQFRDYGMPGRNFKAASQEWRDVVKGLLRTRAKRDLAPLIVRLGYCVGRLQGSIRNRTVYL